MYYVYEQRINDYNSSVSSVRNAVLITNDKNIADKYCKEMALWSWGNAWYWVEERCDDTLYVPLRYTVRL